ncbi:MAG: ABC transporter substrate-binding protein [Nocardioidaceae bacterium]|nr:ABC transporter substrate-binding protein [Nocardioidaceae bacterium]
MANPSRAPAPRDTHELVLDAVGTFRSVRGVHLAHALGPYQGLVELARNALALDGDIELSFHWRDEDDDMVFATVRARGDGDSRRSSLSWQDAAVVPHGITPRELDVLTLLVGGLSNADIAARLWTSPRTITTHVERILAKLGLRSRTAAATLAVEESLVLLPIPGGAEGFERLLFGMVSAPQAPADLTTRRPRTPARVRHHRRSVTRPILLGGAIPQSGETAEDGIEMIRATELAIGEVNARGGISGRPIELVSVDLDIKDADSIEHAFSDLAGRDVDAMLSGYLGHQEIAHRIAADHGAPYLHAATLDSMAQLVEGEPDRFGRVFQICPSDTWYGPGFVEAMTTLRDSGQLPATSGTLAVVRGSWKLGNIGIDATIELAERRGWKVAYVADEVTGEVDWREQGRLIAQLAPTAVLIGSYFVHETVQFMDAFLAAPSPTVLYSLYAPSIPQFRVAMGPRAEGILWATVTGTYSDKVARDFAARYRDAYAVSPGRSHAGIAYDRVRILANAWSDADSPRDFTSVAEAIRRSVHRGVNGAYSLTDVGQSALAYPLSTPDPSIAMAHLVFQIQDNRQRIVYPAPYTEAAFRLPPWWS